MAIVDLFSKRKKRDSGEIVDFYSYDKIPNKLKTQIILIWEDSINKIENPSRNHSVSKSYKEIVRILKAEYGLFVLSSNYVQNTPHNYSSEHELRHYLMETENIEKNIDVIELSFQYLDVTLRNLTGRYDYLQIINAAIQDLNTRFKENGVGYYYADGQINRIDSEFIHKEAVIPALNILRQSGYENAQREFLSAHEHYRLGNNLEAVTECAKSFESTLKIICTKRGWAFPEYATAAPLVQLCFDNGLVPAYWDNHFSALKSILKSGIPTPRNRKTGHGAGADENPVPQVPNELVSYVLHMTASTILFLTEAEKNLKP